MTLGRLLLAWLLVGAWFFAARWAGWRVAEGTAAAEFPLTRWTVGWTLAEAGVVTLFASLWFDSLGSGGWWLLFLLVGLLAAFPARLQGLAGASAPRRPELLRALVDVARYVAAGAILAWRLG